MKYMIEGKDRLNNWTDEVVGNDTNANTFDSYQEAAAMIPGLIKAFSNDDNPPTTDDFRVVERK